MVTVIVNHRDTALRATNLESTVNSTKGCQRLANRFDRNFEFKADRDRRRRIQHVVRAGDMKLETAKIAAMKLEMKFTCQMTGRGMSDTQFRLRAQPVGDGAAIH